MNQRMLVTTSRTNQGIQVVKSYIHKHIDCHLSLDDLAKLTGYNKHYLRKAFKQQIGLTPHAYQRQLRLQRAEHLLKMGMSLAYVATQLGFVDQSHLNRRFKDRYGLTAGEFQGLARPDGD